MKEINERLIDATIYEEDTHLNLDNSMDEYDNSNDRKVEEGEQLVFGNRVITKNRGDWYQVKGVITAVHHNSLDRAVKYNVAPSQWAPHFVVSDVELVKSVSNTLPCAR